MREFLKLTFLAAVIFLILSGCRGAEPPSLPGNESAGIPAPVTGTDTHAAGFAGENRYLWAYNLVFVDPSAPKEKFEIVPVRSVGIHYNVLSWLEKGPCTNCVKIISMTNSDHGTKLVKVSIKHPFTSWNLTGFDVRGIAMFNGSHMFPTAVLNISDRTKGDGELINADGFTTLYNFTTKGFGPEGLQGYLKGKFASIEMPDARLNGFKVFESSDPANTRNAFYAGATISRTYDIDMPDGQFVFGYGVDASWAQPIQKPVEDPMTDFPAQANCYEPYRINVTVKSDTLTSQAGILTLDFAVLDHQGPTSYATPVVECPELFDTPPTVSDLGSGNFEVSIQNVKKTPAGKYPLLISVVDNQNAGSEAWINLTGYQIYKINVPADTGWARTWGSTGYDNVTAVKMDDWGFIYTAGFYQGTVDFDPGPGVAQCTSNSGSIDAFLCKYSLPGTLVWVKTWGGPGVDTVEDFDYYWYKIAVVGDFQDTVDFDPGADVKAEVSNGGTDAYVSLFNTDGAFEDMLAWGGPGEDSADAVVSWNNFLAIGGSFEGTVTLPYCDPITSHGKTDAYVFQTKSSVPLIAHVGGSGEDEVTGLAFKWPNLIATGYFQGTVDFDPGNSGGVRTSNGSADIFLIRYIINLDIASCQWIKAWGGTGWDAPTRVCTGTNDVYVTGSFCGSAGFNPDLPMDPDWHTALGMGDAFISHWTQDGVYQGTTTWGGSAAMGIDSGFDLCLDASGNVYCAGSFSDIALGKFSNGGFDCIVAKYSPDLTNLWATGWGGSGSDGAHAILVDQWNRSYVGGAFAGTVDFNPGSGVDKHTSNGGVADAYLSKLLEDGGW